LSQDPAIRKQELLIDAGENLRHEIESSGGLTTSTSFIGLGIVPKLLVALVDPNVVVAPNVLPPKRAIFTYPRQTYIIKKSLKTFDKKQIQRKCQRNL